MKNPDSVDKAGGNLVKCGPPPEQPSCSMDHEQSVLRRCTAQLTEQQQSRSRRAVIDGRWPEELLFFLEVRAATVTGLRSKLRLLPGCGLRLTGGVYAEQRPSQVPAYSLLMQR